MEKGKLIIFSAPSGSGKTTIIQHLLTLDLELAFSISATSRAPRGEEIHGKDYYFLPTDEFKTRIENDDFLEWEEVYAGRYYGTLKSEVERMREQGKNVLFDVDVVGGTNIKKYYGDEALAVFVQPPSVEELENRLRGRATDSEEELLKRIAKAEEELTYSKHFDTIIINDDLESAFSDAKTKVIDFINKK